MSGTFMDDPARSSLLIPEPLYEKAAEQVLTLVSYGLAGIPFNRQ